MAARTARPAELGDRRHPPAGRLGDLALAIDVGGTKLAAAVVSEDGRILHQQRVPTAGSAERGGEALLADVLALVAKVRGGDEVVCGVGCGGPMTGWGDDQLVSPLNIPAWDGFPLRSRLEGALGLPTFVDNDAKALALGEGWVGGARDVPNFLAMVVSTGVGGGIVLDNRLLDGADGNAGHIGHVIVVPDGRECGCGAFGCLEAEASGTAIANITGRSAEDASHEVKVRTGTLVGRAVASVANLLDLRLALVAGTVALRFGDAFFDAAQEEVDRSARLSFSRGCVVRRAALGDGGPLVGAAAVGWQGLGRRLRG